VTVLAAFTLMLFTAPPGVYGQGQPIEPPLRPPCPDKAADPESAAYCDGGIQNTCEMIESQADCKDTRKDREVIFTTCMDNEGTACVTISLPCWREYGCNWNQNKERCESGELVQQSQTMAKATQDCGAPQ
jgi:hypothetical protein